MDAQAKTQIRKTVSRAAAWLDHQLPDGWRAHATTVTDLEGWPQRGIAISRSTPVQIGRSMRDVWIFVGALFPVRTEITEAGDIGGWRATWYGTKLLARSTPLSKAANIALSSIANDPFELRKKRSVNEYFGDNDVPF